LKTTRSLLRFCGWIATWWWFTVVKQTDEKTAKKVIGEGFKGIAINDFRPLLLANWYVGFLFFY